MLQRGSATWKPSIGKESILGTHVSSTDLALQITLSEANSAAYHYEFPGELLVVLKIDKSAALSMANLLVLPVITAMVGILGA